MTVYAITDTKKRENRDCAYLSSYYPKRRYIVWGYRVRVTVRVRFSLGIALGLGLGIERQCLQ